MARRQRPVAVALQCALVLLSAYAVAGKTITGEVCNGSPDQAWQYDAATQTLSSTQAAGVCLTAAALPLPTDFTALAMQPCSADAAPLQAFLLLPNRSIVLASAPAQCVNLAG